MVVDLFAGTGALGLEALSRGATRAIFVEQNRENVALIHRNLATLRYEDRACVLATDAYRWARAFAPIDDEPLVVFLDPPIASTRSGRGKVNQLLRQLVEELPADSIVAVESRRTLDERVLPDLDVLGHPPLRGDADRDPGPGARRSSPARAVTPSRREDRRMTQPRRASRVRHRGRPPAPPARVPGPLGRRLRPRPDRSA